MGERTEIGSEANPAIRSRDEPPICDWCSADEWTLVPCASCGVQVRVAPDCCLGDALCEECAL